MVDTDADVEELVYSNAAVEWSRYSYDEGSKSIGRGTMDEKCMLRHIGRSLEFEQNRHTTSKEEKKNRIAKKPSSSSSVLHTTLNWRTGGELDDGDADYDDIDPPKLV